MMDAQDYFHAKAKKYFIETSQIECLFYTSNYIIVETIALLQNRLGIEALRSFVDYMMPLLKIYWVDQRIHETALSNLGAASGSKISFVDYTSFKIMRELDIEFAFSFDNHFSIQGFGLIPQ